MSLARRLWQDNADLAAAALAHPFVRGLADGTLRRTVFAGYVAQDAFFLDAFARAYALALAHSTDRPTLDAFASLLAGVRDELRLHASYAQRWGVDLAPVEPSAATTAYVEFLLATAALRGVGATCAAMTPCLRLYAYLGQSLAEAGAGTEAGGPSDVYADWVRTYADPDFGVLAATQERLLDAHAEDCPATEAVYRRAMQLEVAFFDSAHRGT